MLIPKEGETRNPVCGCDGVTYWNPSVAGYHSMAVKSVGACSPGKTCGGIASLQCPSGAHCNYAEKDATSCNISDPAGTCWVVPQTCPKILIGPQTRGCGGKSCSSECELIKAQHSWYPDLTCPV